MPLVKGYDKQAAVSSCVDKLNVFRLFKGELTQEETRLLGFSPLPPTATSSTMLTYPAAQHMNKT